MVLYNGRLGINGLGFPGQQQQDNRRGDWRECCKRQDRLRASVDLMELRSIKISSRIHEAVKNKDIRRLPEVEGFSGQLDENNYHRTLSNLMTVDEAHSSISMRKFDMFNQKLILELDKTDLVGDRITSCKIKVDGLSDGQPNLIPNDVVILTDPKTGVNKMTTILTIQGDYVYLKINRFGDNRMILGDAPNISFISSGLTYEYCERALERTEQDNHLKRIIFESIDGSANVLAPVKIGLEEGMLGDASERLAKLNEPQRLAVTGILAAECRPKPYILFGPPGTGKTHTLVEAIAQIYARNSRAKILFCANSNTCADQTVEKLQKVDLIRPHDIQRLAARDKTDGVNSSRIIVTTNMKSSSLMGEFEYDYVFIDEAGHAHEPESLLPICSLKRDGCLVLAGDPKQLGPVVQCEQAGEYGLGTSMFERIFKFRVYRRQLGTKNYDNRYITKLLYCYRCDPRVLAISNKLFYENELVCINETPASILRIMNLSKPVQMYHTRGTEFQFGNSTSWRNEEEAKNCADLIIRLYKMGFEPDQIGVISPYKLQAKFISKKLEEKLKERALDMLEQRFQTKRLVKRKKEKKNGDVDKPGPSMTPERFVSILRDAMDRIKLDETKTKTKDDDGETETETSEGDDEEVEYEWVYETVRRRDNWLCKINTVDAFQGNEREIIIISTVRTPSGRRKDFIDESRRFNVALSRAKWLLFTVGHKDTLDDLNNWREYMAHAASGDVPRWPRQSIFDNPFEPTGPLFKDDTY